MFDYHVHSHFSSDCDFTMEEMIRGAIQNKLTEICFTDHVDYEYCDPSISFDVDYKAFDDTFFKLKSQYAHEISLKKGVEIGIQPHVIERSSKLVKEGAFDFVICSMHTCDQLDLYRGDFYHNRSPEEAWEKYLEEAIHCAKHFDDYSIFGHLDIPKRYNEEAATAPMALFREYFDALFEILIAKGKGIEVNTSGFRNSFKAPLPTFEIIQWYKEAGGEIITLGSDSHSPDQPGFHFKETVEQLKTIGFDYICSFNDMKPEFQKIESV